MGLTSKLLGLVALGLTGAGFYWGNWYASGDFSISGKHGSREIAKKISPVKPKYLHADQNNFKVTSASVREPYSFFTVLNDPSLSKMVGLNGEIFKSGDGSPVKPSISKEKSEKATVAKISAVTAAIPPKPVPPQRVEAARAPLPPPPAEEKQSIDPVPDLKKAMEELEQLLAGKPFSSSSAQSKTEASGSGQFTIQVSSFRLREQAEALKEGLVKKGYVSFVKQVELPDNKGTWHRVYIGRYEGPASAREAAARFEKEEKLQTMIVRQAG